MSEETIDKIQSDLMTPEQMLNSSGSYVSTTKGVSMRPLFREGRDVVIMESPSRPFRVGDVVLYRVGDKYIFHRIVKIKGDTLVIRGDNTYRNEYLPKTAPLAYLVAFRRGKKRRQITDFSYRAYSFIWRLIYPIRYAFYYIPRRLLVKIYRLIFRKNNKKTV